MFKKIPSHLWPYVVREDEDAYKVFAKLSVSKVYSIMLIVNEEEKLIGVLSMSDISPEKKPPLVRIVLENRDAAIGTVCTNRWAFSRGRNSHMYYSSLNLPSHAYEISRLKTCMRFSHPKFAF